MGLFQGWNNSTDIYKSTEGQNQQAQMYYTEIGWQSVFTDAPPPHTHTPTPSLSKIPAENENGCMVGHQTTKRMREKWLRLHDCLCFYVVLIIYLC